MTKRAPQRQAYRLVELARWRDFLGVPLNLQPQFFPADAASAACILCAAPEGRRMALAGDLPRAVWAEEKNIADLCLPRRAVPGPGPARFSRPGAREIEICKFPRKWGL